MSNAIFCIAVGAACLLMGMLVKFMVSRKKPKEKVEESELHAEGELIEPKLSAKEQLLSLLENVPLHKWTFKMDGYAYSDGRYKTRIKGQRLIVYGDGSAFLACSCISLNVSQVVRTKALYKKLWEASSNKKKEEAARRVSKALKKVLK